MDMYLVTKIAFEDVANLPLAMTLAGPVADES